MTAETPSLKDLGWNAYFEQQVSNGDLNQWAAVRVIAVHRGKIAVAGYGSEKLISPHIRDPENEMAHPTVGDWLLLDRDTLEPVRLLQRASLFKRRPPRADRPVQLIAANIDTLFVVASCNEDFNIARLERYLVLAREAGVNPLIVLTKADLTATPEKFADAARELQPDLGVLVVNARDPQSVAGLADWCAFGKTVALVGSSGVGKSTLVNTLRASDSIATQPVREEDGKGRHTTTVRMLHRLDGGGWLLDTPGMRELQMADAETGLAEVFDDIVALTLACRFANCLHGSEPGCAVQTALANGTLDTQRLQRWQKLVAEEAANSGPSTKRRARRRPSGSR